MIRVAGLLTAVLLLDGCGVRPTGVVYAGDAPVATGPASPSAQIYFLAGQVPVVVGRAVSPWDVQQVFDVLLRGPTARERESGLHTDLAGIRQISIRALGDKMILISTLPPTVKLAPGAFWQLYCTGIMLPDRPMVTFSSVGGVVPYKAMKCPRLNEAVSSSPRVEKPLATVTSPHRVTVPERKPTSTSLSKPTAEPPTPRT
jgi:hypothetical protein